MSTQRTVPCVPCLKQKPDFISNVTRFVAQGRPCRSCNRFRFPGKLKRVPCWVLSHYIYEKGPVPLARDRAFFVMMPSSSSRRGVCLTLLLVDKCRGHSNTINLDPISEAVGNYGIICGINATNCNACDVSYTCILPIIDGLLFLECCSLGGIRICQSRSCNFCICSTNVRGINGLTAILKLVCENGDCDGDEDGDDRNDDQELGQGKALVVFLHLVSPFHSDLLVGIRIDRQTWFQ